MNNKLPNDWQVKKLKDILADEKYSIKRGPFGSSLRKEFFVKEGVRVFEQYNPINNDPNWCRYRIDKNKYEELKAFRCKAGDFLISCSGTLGKIILLPENVEEGIINQALLKIRLNPKLVDNHYFLNLCQYKDFQKRIYKNAGGSAIHNIASVNTLKEMDVILPPLEEQKRIASGISKIDAYLENTIKLIEEKERFKKGISKKLLTCKEGENVPEMRFKEFKDKWETVKLGDICLINNKNLKGNTNKDYKFKYIDLTAVKKGNIDLSKDYITFENAPASARRIINKNDIIMATVRPYLLGHAFIDFEAKDYICSTGFAVLTANADIEMKYIYQYLYSNDMAKQIRSRLEGSTYPTIKNSAIKELKIKIPKSIKEQEEISKFLSLLDAEIDNLKEQKEEIKKMKKGIINKLMSGEVRL